MAVVPIPYDRLRAADPAVRASPRAELVAGARQMTLLTEAVPQLVIDLSDEHGEVLLAAGLSR